MAEPGWGEPATEDPAIEVEDGWRVTCGGVELLRWTHGDEDPITCVGQNRTSWDDGAIEAFCFTTQGGSVLLAIRPPEAPTPDQREVRRLPIMQRATRAELDVGSTEVRLVVDVGSTSEPFLSYEIRSVDTSTVRISFNHRPDGSSDWPSRTRGAATVLATSATFSKDPDGAFWNAESEEPLPEWHHVVLDVYEDGDFFKDTGKVEPMGGRQWSAALKLPPSKYQIYMPGVADKLERLWENHELQRVIDQLIKLVRVTDHHLFIVGGSVRDALLGVRQPKDLDLAGDIPPSMFRFWVRSIAANLDLNMLTDTSPTNVTRIYRRARNEPSAIEYALLKDSLNGDQWSGCNDLYTDYSTRDLAENSLFYSLTTHRIFTASTELDDWLEEGGGPDDPKIDPKKYGRKLTAITVEGGTKLHPGLGPWASANLLARLMKSYARMSNGKQFPDTRETANSIQQLCPEIEQQLRTVASTMGVAPPDIVAAAMLEACSDSLTHRKEAAEWLRDTLADAARQGKYTGALVKDWFPRAIKLACGGEDTEAEWQAPVDLRGRGLAKAVKDGKGWTVDPAGLRLLTWFTPEQVSQKLGAIVSCWEKDVLPMQRDGTEIGANAYRNPTDGSYLVEVDILDNKPIEAPTIRTEGKVAS